MWALPVMKADAGRKAHLFDFPEHSNEIFTHKLLKISFRPATGAEQFRQKVGVTRHVLQAQGCAANTPVVTHFQYKTLTSPCSDSR